MCGDFLPKIVRKIVAFHALMSIHYSVWKYLTGRIAKFNFRPRQNSGIIS